MKNKMKFQLKITFGQNICKKIINFQKQQFAMEYAPYINR